MKQPTPGVYENTPAPQTHSVGTMPCPCTTFEQDEACSIGYPSLLCAACNGTGNATLDTVVALAAEMMKVAEQVDELEDPFAAWESIDLIKTDLARLRADRLYIVGCNEGFDAAIDMSVSLITEFVIRDTSVGKDLANRQEGNQDGLHYAKVIRALAATSASEVSE